MQVFYVLLVNEWNNNKKIFLLIVIFLHIFYSRMFWVLMNVEETPEAEMDTQTLCFTENFNFTSKAPMKLLQNTETLQTRAWQRPAHFPIKNEVIYTRFIYPTPQTHSNSSRRSGECLFSMSADTTFPLMQMKLSLPLQYGFDDKQ